MFFRLLSNITNPIATAVDPYISDLTDFLSAPTTLRIFIKTLFVILVTLSLLLFALLAYALFYYVYVPKVAHTAPIYFAFDTGTIPTAVVDVTKRNERFLEPGQEYDVSVDIVMPTSAPNLEHGNFMVKVDMVDERGRSVYSSSRPAILCYRSWFVKTLSTVLRSVFLMLDFAEESERISKTVIEGFVESADTPVTRAIVSVSSQRLQIYSATIRFDAHFRGLRYMMYYYSISTGVAFILAFLFWETLFSLVGWKVFVSWWQMKEGTVQVERYSDEFGREMISNDVRRSRSVDISSSGEVSWTERPPRGNVTESVRISHSDNNSNNEGDDSEPKIKGTSRGNYSSVASSSSVRHRTRTYDEDEDEDEEGETSTGP